MKPKHLHPSLIPPREAGPENPDELPVSEELKLPVCDPNILPEITL